MRRVRVLAAAAVLAGPFVLAFFTGGYTDGARVWATTIAWLLAVVGLVVGRPPTGRPVLLAVGGLAGLGAWTLASSAWAPVAGTAWDAGQLTVGYLGAFVAAATLLGGRARRWVEPGLAAGTLVVVGYALAERLLPGVLTYTHSISAEGRLEQPLTYWNGMGELAALGIVLCARLAGDVRRRAAVRTLAAAATVPLSLGLSLTVSRGALWACVAGLLTLLVLTRRREQLAAIGLTVVAGVAIALLAAPFDAVTSLLGTLAERERSGLVVLVGLFVLMAAAAVGHHLLASRIRTGELRLPRRAGAVVLVLVAGGFALAVAVGTDERSASGLTPGARRLGTLQSNRYEYWKVAARAFADRPVAGLGAGGWGVRWRMERTVAEGARDAHSLYFQTAAELGVVGLALLAAWLAGVIAAARAALRADRQAVAGMIAGCAVWAAHVALDWDFQLPAASLPAVVLAGALLASAKSRRGDGPRSTAGTGEGSSG